MNQSDVVKLATALAGQPDPMQMGAAAREALGSPRADSNDFGGGLPVPPAAPASLPQIDMEALRQPALAAPLGLQEPVGGAGAGIPPGFLPSRTAEPVPPMLMRPENLGDPAAPLPSSLERATRQALPPQFPQTPNPIPMVGMMPPKSASEVVAFATKLASGLPDLKPYKPTTPAAPKAPAPAQPKVPSPSTTQPSVNATPKPNLTPSAPTTAPANPPVVQPTPPPAGTVKTVNTQTGMLDDLYDGMKLLGKDISQGAPELREGVAGGFKEMGNGMSDFLFGAPGGNGQGSLFNGNW